MSFLRLSALDCAVGAALCAVLFGCGKRDGNDALEQGRAAYEVRDLGKAEKLFEASVECAPQDVDRLMWLARVKLERGELSEAKDLLTKIQTLADGDHDVEMLAAQLAWHAKDYKSAARRFAALAEKPDLDPAVRSQALAGLGVVEATCEEFHLARVAYLSAIRMDRRNAAAWYHLGLLYRDNFDYLDAALEQMEIFVRLETGANPRVQKVQRTVIPALKDALSNRLMDRPGVSKRNSASCSAALAKAEASWKRGAYKDARQNYQAALAADPLSYPAALGLAKAWEKTDVSKDGMKKAFENYKLACTVRPGAISTFLTAGSLAHKLGLHSQAVEIYSRAVAASPTSLDALDGLIRAFRKVGGKESAARAYQRYRDSLVAKPKAPGK